MLYSITIWMVGVFLWFLSLYLEQEIIDELRVKVFRFINICKFCLLLFYKLGFESVNNRSLSHADLVFQVRDLMLALDDQLLHLRFLTLQLGQLLMQVVVLRALQGDLFWKLVEILNDERVQHFDVLVVLGTQMVLHQGDLLSEQLDFLFVVTKCVLTFQDEVLWRLNLC